MKGQIMKTTHSLLTVAAAFAVLGMAGCQKAPEKAPDAAQTQQPGDCKPDAALALTGKAAISDAEAMQLTGATIVRQIKPGDAVTMDFRKERVTVETDPKTGKITRAMCG